MMDYEYFLIGFGAGIVFVFFLLSFRTWVDRREEKRSLNWNPLPSTVPQVPKVSLWNKLMKKDPPLIFVNGVQVQACSTPTLHNIKGSKCVWCGLTTDQISFQGVGPISLNPQQLKTDPQPDFNSPTTATVNSIPRIDPGPVSAPPVQTIVGQPVLAYCLKCKARVIVLDPSLSTEQTRKGVRNYLHGSCSACGSRINAIVKRG